jgi:putative MATE family efflux protein
MKQQHHVTDMGKQSISRLLLRFSLPATLAMAVMASYNVVDAAFVGRLGSEALAALSVSFPIQMVFAALGIGTGIGAASLISRSLGAEKYESARIAAGQVIFLAVLFGVALTLTGLFFLEPVLVFFGATPDILQLTVDYMSVITSCAVLMFLLMMLNHSVRAEGNALLPMIVMIVSAVSNIIMDPIFIFVLGMGVKGAAVATILAKGIGAVMLLWFYLSGRSALKIGLKHLRPHWRVIVDIYKVGLPSLLTQASYNISLIVANRILGGYSHVAIAAMGIIIRLQQFAFMPVIGITQGLLPIIGYNYGAGKKERIREAMIKGFAGATILVSAAGISFFAFPGLFIRIFTGDAEVLASGIPAVRIMVAMYPLLSIPLICGSFFQGIGKALPALIISLMRQFLLYVPLILFMPSLFGLTGIWMATPVADLLTFFIAAALAAFELKRQGILYPAAGKPAGGLLSES